MRFAQQGFSFHLDRTVALLAGVAMALCMAGVCS